MSKSPYDVLGVAKTASDDDIRKAYRKLAKELHPDLNPGDQAAEERFKQVSAAFAIIGDAEKKAAYDRGDIDETGAEKPQQQYYRQYADTDAPHQYHTNSSFQDFGDLGDIFQDMFGRTGRASAGPNRGADVRYHLKISFLEAAKGEKKRITMPDGVTLDVTIPRGVNDGDVIRLKGKGHPGHAGGPAGDALVAIEIEPHPQFKRDGLDISIDLPITIDQAVLGAKVDVPTIDGVVSMTVPKGVSSDRVMRLKGRGVGERTGKTRGDQLVRLAIVLPDKIDKELEDFMKEWRARHADTPREQ